MNNDWILSAAVGVSLLTLGVSLVRSHIRTWRKQQDDATLEDGEHLHLRKRFRRRVQASGLIALLGATIPFGDIALPLILPQNPMAFAIYWSCVLLVTMWVILLGFADMLATSSHARVALNRVQRKQRALHEQIAEIKRRSAGGRDASGD